MDRKALFELLGSCDIPGSQEQIEALETRVAELVQLNGRRWVRENRLILLEQWKLALGFGDNISPSKGPVNKTGRIGQKEYGMAELKRLHVIVKGKVQGVCYRLETQKAARRFGVAGWVRNLPDGSVEGVFEGREEAVEKLVQWCRQGPALSVVTDLKIKDQNYSGKYSGFEIRF